MKLGPETRRQVGDNYEQIIFQLLKDFGWRAVRENFEISVSKDIRVSGQQGGDGTFAYFDPLLNYHIGVYVESKKCKNLDLFRKELPKWLTNVDSMVHSLDTNIFSLPFRERSGNDLVRVQEGLLSVWIDEDFQHAKFRSITEERIKKFLLESSNKSEFAVITVFANSKLLQLQAVVTQLFGLVGKHKLSGSYQFVYPTRGPEEAPNLMMLSSDYLFVRALEEGNGGHFQLVVFHLGETSMQQLKHFTASVINVLGDC